MTNWTYEIQYQSRERKAITGRSILRDSFGSYIGEAETEFARLIVDIVNSHEDMLKALSISEGFIRKEVEMRKPSNDADYIVDASEKLKIVQQTLRKAGVS